MSGTHSMICMLCDVRITCPWEREIEPIALAAGWVELPKSERRRTPHHACQDCAAEMLTLVLTSGRQASTAVMPAEPEREYYDIERTTIRALTGWLSRWPNFRTHLSFAQLGSAVALADLMGVDAEGFIRQLRAKGMTPKASGQIEPPEGS